MYIYIYTHTFISHFSDAVSASQAGGRRGHGLPAGASAA